MPLTGESERVLPQSGHSTDMTELSVNRLRSMGTTILENVHLGDVLVCTSCAEEPFSLYLVGVYNGSPLNNCKKPSRFWALPHLV
jgi:hypothetical protein